MQAIRQTILYACCAALALPALTRAETKGFQVAIADPIQRYDAATSISGLRINFWYSKNHHMSGVDLGGVNHFTGNFKGVQFGEVNMVDGKFKGWQVGTINRVGGRFSGVQTSFIYNRAGQFKGIQFGLGYNRAGQFKGVQIGLWNRVESLKGVQIGLLNFNKSSRPLGFLPIINFGF